MQAFWSVVYVLLSVFWFLLIIRLIVEWVKVFARDWFPTGLVAVILEAVFSASDPPLKAIRKVIKPVSIGSIRLDLAFLVLFLVVGVLQAVARSLAA